MWQLKKYLSANLNNSIGQREKKEDENKKKYDRSEIKDYISWQNRTKERVKDRVIQREKDDGVRGKPQNEKEKVGW